jgi:serine protease inhibitor
LSRRKPVSAVPVPKSLSLSPEPALELVKALLGTQSPDGNVFFSPVSLQAALCAAAFAATPGSATAAELLRTFGSPSTTLEDALELLHASCMSVDSTASATADANAECLHVANALFANDVKPEFTAALQSRMGATALALTSAADVNAWCETQTRGAIPRIIDDGAISPQTVMLLVNALPSSAKFTDFLLLSQTSIPDVRLPNSCLFLDLGCSVN